MNSMTSCKSGQRGSICTQIALICDILPRLHVVAFISERCLLDECARHVLHNTVKSVYKDPAKKELPVIQN